jgi:hypothetical protein
MPLVERGQKITQAHMDELAILANLASISGSWGKTFTFASGSASGSLWFTEYNRLRNTMFSASGFSDNIAVTQSNYTQQLDCLFLTSESVPRYTSQHIATTCGPVTLAVSQSSLTTPQNKWHISEPILYYVNRGTNRKMFCSASLNGTLTNNSSSFFLSPPISFLPFQGCWQSDVTLRIGGDRSGNCSCTGSSAFSGLGLYVSVVSASGGFPPMPITSSGPNINFYTNMPGATTFQKLQPGIGDFQYLVGWSWPIQDVDPGVYRFSIDVTNHEWACEGRGHLVCGSPINFQITVATASVGVPAVCNIGQGVNKLVGPSNSGSLSGSGWPFGLFYAQYANSSTGLVYRDVNTGVYFTGSTGQDLRLFASPNISFTTDAPAADCIWAGTTYPLVAEGQRDIDRNLPFTRTSFSGSSTMRTGSLYEGTITTPSHPCGLAEWPLLYNISQSNAITSSFRNSFVGHTLASALIINSPVVNSYGISINPTQSVDKTITIGFVSASVFKTMDTYIISQSTSATYLNDLFIPVFQPLPLILSGSNTETVCFYPISTNQYALIQADVSSNQDLKVPWKSPSQFPISAHIHYNPIYKWLSGLVSGSN